MAFGAFSDCVADAPGVVVFAVVIAIVCNCSASSLSTWHWLVQCLMEPQVWHA